FLSLHDALPIFFTVVELNQYRITRHVIVLVSLAFLLHCNVFMIFAVCVTGQTVTLKHFTYLEWFIARSYTCHVQDLHLYVSALHSSSHNAQCCIYRKSSRLISSHVSTSY